MSLIDSATDLINNAKMSPDVTKILFNLEQVKEIVFHRDKTIYLDVAPDVFEFMSNKSTRVHKFLVSFAAEGFYRQPSSVNHILSLFSYLTSCGPVENITRGIAREVVKIYDKLVARVVNTQSRTDGRLMWGQLQATVSGIVNILSLPMVSDLVKCDCFKCCETVLLFCLPDAAQSSDPRRARSSATTMNSSADIPLHHAFISRTDLEQQADDIFSKFLLWCSRGGPQKNQPFSQTLMGALTNLIAKIALERPKKIKQAAKSLTVYLEGAKQNDQIPMADRDKISKAVQRMIHVAATDHDTTTAVNPLKEALAAFDAVTSGRNTSTVISDPRKRGRAAVSSDSAGADLTKDVEGGEDTAANQDSLLRASAVSAVDLVVEDQKRHRKTASVSASSSTTHSDIASNAQIDFSSDLWDADAKVVNTVGDVNSNTPVNVCSQAALASLKRFLDGHHEHPDQGVLLPTDSKMNSYMSKDNQATVVFAKLVVNLVLTMSQVDLVDAIPPAVLPSKAAMANNLMYISIVTPPAISPPEDPHKNVLLSTTNSTSVVTMTYSSCAQLLDGVPLNVLLPSYILTNLIAQNGSYIVSGANGHRKNKKVDKMNKDKTDYWLDLLLVLIRELYARARHQQREMEAKMQECTEEVNIMVLYEHMCVVGMSRLMQCTGARWCTLRFLTSLPDIPMPCITYLNLLTHLGTTKQLQSTAQSQTSATEKYKGSRSEAAHLLSKLIFHPYSTKQADLALEEVEVAADDMEVVEAVQVDEVFARCNYHVACRALNSLLWSTVSPDFESRSNAVIRITEDVAPLATVYDEETEEFKWIKPHLCSFALQSAALVVGVSTVKARFAQRSSGDISKVKSESEESHMDADNDDVSPSAAPLLESTLDGYDLGLAFSPGGGPFAPFAWNLHSDNMINVTDDQRSKLEQDQVERMDTFCQRHFHLLTQLCLLYPFLITGFLDIYGSAVWMKRQFSRGTDDGQLCICPLTITTITSRMKSYFQGIMSAVISQKQYNRQSADPDTALFGYLTSADPLSAPLITYGVQLICGQLDKPAPKGLVTAVQTYAKRCFGLLHPLHTADVEGTAAPPSLLYTKLMIPLLGGLSSKEIEAILPQIILFFDAKSIIKHQEQATKAAGTVLPAVSTDNIKDIAEEEIHSDEWLRNSDQFSFSKVVNRLTHCRPPPVSYANILTFLHRLDYKKHGLTLPNMMDSIGVCLEKKEVFTSAVIRETVSSLLLDAMPAETLMRTALLTCQTHLDLKKFLVMTVMPTLIGKKTWEIAPKVWDGVVYGIKKFAAHREAAPTIRAILTLPGRQLKVLLKSMPAELQLDCMLRRELDAVPSSTSLEGSSVGRERLMLLTGVQEGDSTALQAALQSYEVDNEKKELIVKLEALVLPTAK